MTDHQLRGARGAAGAGRTAKPGERLRTRARRRPLVVAASVLCAAGCVVISLRSAFAQTQPAQLTVEVTGQQGVIFLDGEPVAEGSLSQEVTAGRHEVRIAREGYEERKEVITLRPGEVHALGVTLRQQVSDSLKGPDQFVGGAPAGGLYGGVQLLGALQPAGSGTTMQNGCDTLGANRCSPGSVLGGGLSGYVGYLLSPIGLELSMMISADRVQPTANFDGVAGAEINPVVAQPARTESFYIGRFGGGAAVRLRVVKRVSQVDFSVAAGPGVMYRVFGMTRDTVTDAGNTSAYADAGTSYLSPYLSLETAVGMRIGSTTSIALGLVSWIEHAGDRAVSREEPNTVIEVGSNPVYPQATPPYDLASGAQWFFGPFVGLSFGQ